MAQLTIFGIAYVLDFGVLIGEGLHTDFGLSR